MSRLTMRQPTLTFAIHLHGRLVVLAPFPYLFRSLRQRGSAPASLVSGQDREGLYSFVLHNICRSRCSCSRSRAHCSRSSSTGTGSCCSRCYRDGSYAPSVSAAALSFQRTQPHQRRLLRFACAIWSLAWISCILAVAPLPYINPSKSMLGFTVKIFPCRAA